MFFVLDIHFHDVECELILNILTDVVAVLTMAIAHTKVPQILDLGEIFDYKEVVLVGFSHTIGCLAGPCQVGKLGDVVLDFSDLLRRWLRHLRLSRLRYERARLAIRVTVIVPTRSLRFFGLCLLLDVISWCELLVSIGSLHIGVM